MDNFLLKGFIIGLSIAAPVGPIGVLCIRRTLSHGRLSGFVSGMGAATADAFYGIVAGFGLTVISSFLVEQQFYLRLIGGAFLLYLGYTTLKSKPAEKPASAKEKGILADYLSTLLLTVTNPLTILSFAAIFAGLGISNTQGNYASATLLVLGVFLGSAIWWLLLSSGISLFKKKFKPEGLRWINILSGIIILGFGFFSLGSLLLH